VGCFSKQQIIGSLSNKVALVTGASRGIGRATAKALADAGARVLVHHGSASAEADALVAEIRMAGGSADAMQADLSATEGAAILYQDRGWSQPHAAKCSHLKESGNHPNVADVIAFFASDGARWITGASIPVGGGSKLSMQGSFTQPGSISF